MTITEHRLKIERVVRRGAENSCAEFYLKTPTGNWWACTASYWPKAGVEQIETRRTAMSLDQANTVSVALGMAIEWIAEEMAK